MFPFIPAGIAILVGGAWLVSSRFNVKPTPAQQIVFQKALADEKDPVKLRALAAEFSKAGLKAEAAILIKRAKLRELPPEVKEARKEAFRKAMSLTNKAAVLKFADLEESEGADGAAQKLREYAKGLS